MTHEAKEFERELEELVTLHGSLGCNPAEIAAIMAERASRLITETIVPVNYFPTIVKKEGVPF